MKSGYIQDAAGEHMHTTSSVKLFYKERKDDLPNVINIYHVIGVVQNKIRQPPKAAEIKPLIVFGKNPILLSRNINSYYCNRTSGGHRSSAA